MVHEFLHVVIQEAAEVVPPGGFLHVVDISIHQMAGGVYGARDDLAQGGETGLTGAGAGNQALDLGVVLHPAQLEGVSAVVDHDHVVEVGAHQSHHLLLPVGELEEVVTGIPVAALVEGVIIGAHIVGVACAAAGGVASVHHAEHIVRQVRTLAADAGDDNHGSIGKFFGVVDKFVRVQADVRLRQGPILGPHAYDGPVGLVVDIKVFQLGVELNARVRQALEQGNGGIGVVERAGAGAAVAGVGGGPAEYVQLGAAGQGQDAVLILQQHNALLRHLGHQSGGLGGGLLGEIRCFTDQIQHTGHRACADQVCHDDHGQEQRQSGL